MKLQVIYAVSAIEHQTLIWDTNNRTLNVWALKWQLVWIVRELSHIRIHLWRRVELLKLLLFLTEILLVRSHFGCLSIYQTIITTKSLDIFGFNHFLLLLQLLISLKPLNRMLCKLGIASTLLHKCVCWWLMLLILVSTCIESWGISHQNLLAIVKHYILLSFLLVGVLDPSQLTL